MEQNATIVLKKKLEATDLAGEKVMIDFETGKYFLIKGAGNDIWDMLQEATTVESIVERLMSEYEVTREECQTSVMDFLDRMKSLGFID